jgi:Ca2+-transporting ATPase
MTVSGGTSSGRVSFTGSGYSPEGEVQREGGGAVDGTLREELLRALAAADPANNATVREENGRWLVEGKSDGGRALVAARKAGFSETFDARFRAWARFRFPPSAS